MPKGSKSSNAQRKWRSCRITRFGRSISYAIFDVPPDDGEKRFGSRPKLDGLWVRLTFRDEQVYEGVITNDLLQIGEHGVTITPPEANSNTQRIFVPRKSLAEMKVLSVHRQPRPSP